MMSAHIHHRIHFATADFSALGAPFSASAEFEFVEKKTGSEKTVFLESEASCELYYARIEVVGFFHNPDLLNDGSHRAVRSPAHDREL